jgi:hypothetical protein
MAFDLLRIAAEQGLLVVGLPVGPGVERPGWRLVCQRCRGWLALPARPPEATWWLRRVCAFAVRHRHPPRHPPRHPARPGTPPKPVFGGSRTAGRVGR